MTLHHVAAGVRLALVPVLLLSVGACHQERTPDASTLAAREKVRTGLELTDAADSARLEYWMEVTSEESPAIMMCFDVAWDMGRSPGGDHDIRVGYGSDLKFGGTCGVGPDSMRYLVRDDVLYVEAKSEAAWHREMFGNAVPIPDDVLERERRGPYFRWAHVAPEALDEVVTAVDDNEKFHELVATAELVDSPSYDRQSGEDEELVFDVEWDALVDAGLVEERVQGSWFDGRISFRFTRDALTRIDLRLTGDGVNTHVRQVYSGLNEPQSLEHKPTTDQLHPESPRLTSADEVSAFLGLR